MRRKRRTRKSVSVSALSSPKKVRAAATKYASALQDKKTKAHARNELVLESATRAKEAAATRRAELANALDIKHRSAAAKRKVELAIKTAQCAVRCVRHGKHVYFAAAKKRAAQAAAQRLSQRSANATKAHSKRLQLVVERARRHHLHVAAQQAKAALRRECDMLQRKNALTMRVERAALNKQILLEQRAGHASWEALRHAHTVAMYAKCTLAQRALRSARLATKMATATSRRAAFIEQRVVECGRLVLRARNVSTAIKAATRDSADARMAWLQAKTDLASAAAREVTSTRAAKAAAHVRHVMNVHAKTKAHRAAARAKSARRVAYRKKKASQRRSEILSAHSTASGDHFRRAIQVASIQKVLQDVALEEKRRIMSEREALVTARRIVSPVGAKKRSIRAGAHFQHVLEVASATKAKSNASTSAAARRMNLRVEAAAARREENLLDTARKSSEHTRRARDVAAMTKTKQDAEKTQVSSRIASKAEQVRARHESILRDIANKSGARYRTALHKAATVKAQKECQQKENYAKCMGRLARAANRRSDILSMRIANAAPRTINGRRFIAAQAC